MSLAFDLNPVATCLLDVLTGISGGIVRDLLVRETPIVRRVRFTPQLNWLGSWSSCCDAIGEPPTL